MIKSLMIFFLSFLILLISFATGWITIQCDGNKVMRDFDNYHPNNGKVYGKEKPDEDYEMMNEYLTSGRYKLVKHILRYGETLYDLQKNYGTDWHIIQRVNKISDVRRLRSGQVIYIPVKVELG